MIARTCYRFRSAKLTDLTMIRQWLETSDVAKWWSDGDPFDRNDLTDGRISQWIVSFEDRPFAYMQDYDVHGWPSHHFDYLPGLARGIDQFIGVPGMIGRGHGTRFIVQHIQTLFEHGAPVIATDPHPENTRAIASYRKAGFRIVGAPQDTEWGRVVPMEATPPKE